MKLRAQRLEINNENLLIYPQTLMEKIRAEIDEVKPDFIMDR